MSIWRYLFAASAVLFVVGIVAQIFLAGLGLPGLGGGGMQTHIDFGYTLSLAPIVPLLLAWPARAGRRTIVMCAILLVLTFVQTLLPSAAAGRGNIPWVAALHPINAFIVLGLGVAVARRALALVRVDKVSAAPVDESVAAAPQP
ncbi:MAG TPA: DUF6220 domain-containing protein [Candidatus Limnocylindria bacterium]|nr:DUF6220 domain-containing protein [Candidatus Limnocylindria bacterium]